MRSTRTLAAMVALAVVHGVLRVSAESPRPARKVPDDAAPRAWPCRLGAPPEMMNKIAELWASSPTFRRQCIGIAQAGVIVGIGYSPLLASRVLATSRILVRDGRAFYAMVTLRDDLHVERDLPHELEHVLEHIEGRDLAIDAARRREAWASTPGVYETERAIAAGELAGEEVRRGQAFPEATWAWATATRPSRVTLTWCGMRPTRRRRTCPERRGSATAGCTLRPPNGVNVQD